MLLPRLYITARPILIMNRIGIRKESVVTKRTNIHRATAIAVYTIISLSTRFLVSVEIADILDRKQFLPAICRSSSTASIVSSCDVVVSKKRNISVLLPSLP